MIIFIYLLFFGIISAASFKEEKNISFVDFKKAIIKNDLESIQSFKSNKSIDNIGSMIIDDSLCNLTYEMYAFYNKCNLKTLKYLLNTSENIFNLDSENHSIVFYLGNYCLDHYSKDIFDSVFMALVTCINERRLLILNIISANGIVAGYTKEGLALELHILLYKLKQFQQFLKSDLEQLQRILPEAIFLLIKNDLVEEIDDKILKLITLFEINKHWFSCMNLFMQAVADDDMSALEDLFLLENKTFLDLDETSRTVFYYLSLKYREPDVKMLSCVCDGIRHVISNMLLKITTPLAMEEFYARLHKFNSRFIIDINDFAKYDKAREILDSFHKFIIETIKTCELKIDFNIISRVRSAIEGAELNNPINVSIVESKKWGKSDDYSYLEKLVQNSKIVNNIKDSSEEKVEYFDELSPILLALFLGEWDVAEILLENGASVYSTASCKYILADALFVAIASKNLDIVEKICDYIAKSIGLKSFIERFILKKRYIGVLGNANVSNSMLEILQNIIRSKIRSKKFNRFYAKVLETIIIRFKSYIEVENALRNFSGKQEQIASQILAITTLEDMLDFEISLREFLSLSLAPLKLY